MRIYESPPPPPGQEQNDKEREAEERRRDTELSAEIAQRKKSTNERNIKLTAVLMASRRMLGASLSLCSVSGRGVMPIGLLR